MRTTLRETNPHFHQKTNLRKHTRNEQQQQTHTRERRTPGTMSMPLHAFQNNLVPPHCRVPGFPVCVRTIAFQKDNHFVLQELCQGQFVTHQGHAVDGGLDSILGNARSFGIDQSRIVVQPDQVTSWINVTLSERIDMCSWWAVPPTGQDATKDGLVAFGVPGNIVMRKRGNGTKMTSPIQSPDNGWQQYNTILLVCFRNRSSSRRIGTMGSTQCLIVVTCSSSSSSSSSVG